MLLGALLFISSSYAANSQQKFPPYPDRWGFDAGARGIAYLCAAQDGDFYVVPGKFYNDHPKTRIRALFSGTVTEADPKTLEAAARQKLPLGNLGSIACRDHSERYPASLTLLGGHTVELKCSTTWCSYPFFDVGLELRDSNQRVIARKSFLYLLNSPRTESLPFPKVSEDVAGDVTVRVLDLKPALIPLADDSFLVYLGFAVIRFDKAFNTRLPINRRNVFVVDTDSIETIYREQESSHPRGSLAWHQAVLDAVAELLSNIRKGSRS